MLAHAECQDLHPRGVPPIVTSPLRKHPPLTLKHCIARLGIVEEGTHLRRGLADDVCWNLFSWLAALDVRVILVLYDSGLTP